MKLRTLPLAVVAAAAILIPTNTLIPAYAAPAAPGIDTLDSSVAGTVSGTVSSSDNQPFVFVSLVGSTDTATPDQLVTLANSTAFSFTSWGYGAGTTVQAWACPTSTYVEADCSTPTSSAPFTPTDTDPGVTFSSDQTVGPVGDVTLSVTDSGGGELFGQWDNGNLSLPARFSVSHSASDQVVTVADGDDGEVHLYRCDNLAQDHCVEEAGSPSTTYQIRRTMTAAVGSVIPVSSGSPMTSFDVATGRTGTYSVSWHLEQGGNPVAGYGASNVTGNLSGGDAQNIPVDGTGLAAGDYDIVGTITVVDPSFGTYSNVALTGGTLTSNGDVTAPVIDAITPSPTTIYPGIVNTTTQKSSTTVTVTGSGVPDVAAVKIYRDTTDDLVRTRTLNNGKFAWGGTDEAQHFVPAGDYTIKAEDADHNVSSTVGHVTVVSITSIKASPTKIYPLIKNNSTYKSSTTFTVTGYGAPDVVAARLYKHTSTGDTFFRDLTVKPKDTTHVTVPWSGLKPDATPAPAGFYVLKVEHTDGTISPTVGSVSVSGQKLVLKVWSRTVTPAGTLADKYVGKCSTLRKPSLRGWYYSLGYYANTQCASQTAKDSLVSTLHAVFLPKAAQYVDIHVTAYGGAAKAKPGSKAIIRYLTTAGGWTSDKTLPSALGYHSGYTRTTTGLVFKDHSFGWGFYTGFGYQYDVKSFTVVLHYKVLG